MSVDTGYRNELAMMDTQYDDLDISQLKEIILSSVPEVSPA